jgi:DNA repair exonuclease SbcCD ATPase subunit
MTQQSSVLTIEEEIASLRSRLSDRERALRETQQAINKLTEAPHYRAQQIKELEEQLQKKLLNAEIVYEQAAMYSGTDQQSVFNAEAKQTKQHIEEYKKHIEDTRQKHAEQDKEEAIEKRNYQNTEQTILRTVSSIKSKLQILEKQYAESFKEQGELAYAAYKQKYLEVVQSSKDKQKAQEHALSHLAAWPHLQERFLREHALEDHVLPEPATGIAHIARAAIAYIDALIEHGEELQDMFVQDGVSISELLSLSEQEVLVHGYRNGIDVLQQKRAALMKFV